MSNLHNLELSRARAEACEIRKREPLANTIAWLAVVPLFLFMALFKHMDLGVLIEVSIGTSLLLLVLYAQVLCYGKILYINSNTKRSLAKIKRVQTFPFWLVSISITVIFALAGILWH